MKIRFLRTGLLLLTPWMVGCGGGTSEPKNRPKRTPVSGVVTLKGTPVEGATVTFHPTQGGSAASGRTNASGEFVLGTFSADDGAVPASYNVSIIKLDGGPAVAQPAPGEPGYDPNPKPVKSKHLLPEKYADMVKSGLTQVVGTEPITDLELKLE